MNKPLPNSWRRSFKSLRTIAPAPGLINSRPQDSNQKPMAAHVRETTETTETNRFKTKTTLWWQVHGSRGIWTCLANRRRRCFAWIVRDGEFPLAFLSFTPAYSSNRISTFQLQTFFLNFLTFKHLLICKWRTAKLWREATVWWWVVLIPVFNSTTHIEIA